LSCPCSRSIQRELTPQPIPAKAADAVFELREGFCNGGVPAGNFSKIMEPIEATTKGGASIRNKQIDQALYRQRKQDINLLWRAPDTIARLKASQEAFEKHSAS